MCLLRIRSMFIFLVTERETGRVYSDLWEENKNMFGSQRDLKSPCMGFSRKYLPWP